GVEGQKKAGAGLRYDHLPFFYSDLFKLGYEAVGEVDVRHEIVADWKDPMREGVVYYLEAGRVRGVLLWNTWEQVDAARALIAEPGPFRPEPLKGRLPARQAWRGRPRPRLVDGDLDRNRRLVDRELRLVEVREPEDLAGVVRDPFELGGEGILVDLAVSISLVPHNAV